jgi:septal ring factor EnvC (AmiA/AmiB activator)
MMGMSKPVFALVAATFLITSGSAAWFFSQWLSIPGLQQEVARLEEQVGRLSQEVDDLAYENTRYTLLNARLNETVVEYQSLNSQLNASTARLENLNLQLNQSNTVFAELNMQLSGQNQVYSSLNRQLNQTQAELAAINDDLIAVVGFLNDTSINLQLNLKGLVAFLAEQIAVSRVLVLETLKNTYQQRSQNWDCGLRDYFSTEPFVYDGTPINADNSTNLSHLLGYVEDRLLADLCLDLSDLEVYLIQDMPTNTTDLGALTSDELLQGISRYVSLAMDYYFANNPVASSDDGVALEAWAEAVYQCRNLARPFRWSSL